VHAARISRQKGTRSQSGDTVTSHVAIFALEATTNEQFEIFEKFTSQADFDGFLGTTTNPGHPRTQLVHPVSVSNIDLDPDLSGHNQN
jgi:hypothetical protein